MIGRKGGRMGGKDSGEVVKREEEKIGLAWLQSWVSLWVSDTDHVFVRVWIYSFCAALHIPPLCGTDVNLV